MFWPSARPECAARFGELFDERAVPDFLEVVDGYLPGAETCLQAPDAERIFGSRMGTHYISIKSHGNFWNGDRETYLSFLRMLRPSAGVMRLLGSWSLGGINVAFHIRMTDNEKAIRLSPFELFVKKIGETEGPVMVFSDEARAIEALREMFDGRITAPEKIRQRHTVDGMKEAAAVFFALGAAKQIFGSANSSFSEIAAEYGSGRLVVLRQP